MLYSWTWWLAALRWADKTETSTEIYNLRKNSNSPAVTAMHNEKTKKIISSFYPYEIRLYNKCFNTGCSKF